VSSRDRETPCCGCEDGAILRAIISSTPGLPFSPDRRGQKRVSMIVRSVSARTSWTVIEPTPPAPPMMRMALAAPGTGVRISSRSNSISQAVIAVSRQGCGLGICKRFRLAPDDPPRRRDGIRYWCPAAAASRRRKTASPRLKGRHLVADLGRPRPTASQPTPSTGRRSRHAFADLCVDRIGPRWPARGQQIPSLGGRPVELDVTSASLRSSAAAVLYPMAFIFPHLDNELIRGDSYLYGSISQYAQKMP